MLNLNKENKDTQFNNLQLQNDLLKSREREQTLEKFMLMTLTCFSNNQTTAGGATNSLGGGIGGGMMNNGGGGLPMTYTNSPKQFTSGGLQSAFNTTQSGSGSNNNNNSSTMLAYNNMQALLANQSSKISEDATTVNTNKL